MNVWMGSFGFQTVRFQIDQIVNKRIQDTLLFN